MHVRTVFLTCIALLGCGIKAFGNCDT